MKMLALEPAYEAARTWAARPISHPPTGWAYIVRHGMASWMQQTPPEMESPKPFPQRAHLDSSKLITLVAAMIAEVCQ